jgi:DNA-directed RNA polymerase specialized sigma24 family protein
MEGFWSVHSLLAVIRATARYEPVRWCGPISTASRSSCCRRSGASWGRDQPADLIAISSHDSDERLWARQALDRLEANDREILMLREYEPLS